MNNLSQHFIDCLSESFEKFLIYGSNSNKKLYPIHSTIAQDIINMLDSANRYSIKALGIGNNKEGTLQGRYMDKKTDIVIYKDQVPICGIAVKFVMQNYSQNSNNYFENMLGETANIRTKGIPYFQVFVILDQLPHYDDKKKIKHWEVFNEHYMKKYVKLSNDNTDLYLHTPNKTLLFVVRPEITNYNLTDRNEYTNYYLRNPKLTISPTAHLYGRMSQNVILNDYDCFIRKIYHTIMSL